MSIKPEHLAELCARGKPVLFPDTCILLDLMRDITAERVLAHNIAACLALLEECEVRGRLAVCIASQVLEELASNADAVEAASRRGMDAFYEETRRIDSVAALFGANGTIVTDHLRDHMGRARETMDRWQRVAYAVESDDAAKLRAFGRIGQRRAPARSGKENAKDCVVIETYFGAADALRKAGFTAPIVFASSNTKEFCEPGTSRLHSGLEAEFRAAGMEYVTNYGAAKHELGL